MTTGYGTGFPITGYGTGNTTGYGTGNMNLLLHKIKLKYKLWKLERRVKKMRQPLLLSDLKRAIKKLPDPDNFPPDSVSIPIKDFISGIDRSLLFTKREAIKGKEKKKYWTLWVDIAVEYEKPPKTKVRERSQKTSP